MKRFIINAIFLGLSSCCFGQFDFLFSRKSLSDLRRHEDSIKSKPIGFIQTFVAEGYFPGAKEKKSYYPLNFIRTNDPFYPALHIQYFYNEQDSSLLSASYDWNIMDYVKNIKTDGYKFDIEAKRENEYLSKYASIKAELIKKFGNPNSVQEDKTDAGFFYKLGWDHAGVNILVLLKFSTQVKHLPGGMKIGSYAIRVKVDYK